MTKNEIIENLYKSGKITFEEAKTLANTSGKEPELTLIEGVANVKNMKKDQIIKDCIDEIIYGADDDLSRESFDIDKCIKAMKANNWKWVARHPRSFCDMEEVTYDIFKEELEEHVRSVIDGVLDNYNNKVHVEDGYFYSIESGGIKVTGWIEDWGEGYGNKLCVKPEFILEDGEWYIDFDELKETL